MCLCVVCVCVCFLTEAHAFANICRGSGGRAQQMEKRLPECMPVK